MARYIHKLFKNSGAEKVQISYTRVYFCWNFCTTPTANQHSLFFLYFLSYYAGMKVFSNIIDVEAVFLSVFFLGAFILLLFLPMFGAAVRGGSAGVPDC